MTIIISSLLKVLLFIFSIATFVLWGKLQSKTEEMEKNANPDELNYGDLKALVRVLRHFIENPNASKEDYEQGLILLSKLEGIILEVEKTGIKIR